MSCQKQIREQTPQDLRGGVRKHQVDCKFLQNYDAAVDNFQYVIVYKTS